MERVKSAKKLCAFILAFVMVFTNAQMSVFAEAAQDTKVQTMTAEAAVSAEAGGEKAASTSKDEKYAEYTDIKDYLKSSVEIYKDLDGKDKYNPEPWSGDELTREGTIYIKLEFSEDSSEGGIQFPDNGKLCYQIPDVLKINEPVSKPVEGYLGSNKETIGTMTIDINGMITFDLFPKTVSDYNNITIEAMFGATFDSEKIGTKDEMEIVFNDTVKIPVRIEPCEDVAVKKDVAKKPNSDTEFEYTVTVESTKGATNVVVKDRPGENLLIDKSSFKLNGKDISSDVELKNGEYVINIERIDPNGKALITYDASINTNSEAFEKLNGTLTGTGNNVNAKSQYSKETGTSAEAKYEHVILSKTAAVMDADGKTATWTVTVNENTKGKDISGWIVKDSLENRPGFTLDESKGLVVTVKDQAGNTVGSPETVSWDDPRITKTDNSWEFIIPDGEGTYTYTFTYHTNMVSSEVKGPEVKNTAQLLKPDRTPQYEKTSTGTMQGAGIPTNTVQKKSLGVVQNGDTKYLKWQSTVNVPANTEYTNVKFHDKTNGSNGYNGQKFLDEYSIVKNDNPGYDQIGITSTNANINPENWLADRSEYDTLIISGKNNETITLPKSDVPYTVTLTYYTVLTEDFYNQQDQTRTNTIKMSVDGVPAESTAKYTEEVSEGLSMTKSAGTVDVKNRTIAWNLIINKDKKNDIPDEFTIVDTLDEGKKAAGHKFADPGTVKITYGTSADWLPTTLPKTYYTVEPSEDNRSFTIHFSGLEQYKWHFNWSESALMEKPVVLKVEYTTSIQNEALLEEGKLTFDNKAVLKEGGTEVTASDNKAEYENIVFDKTQVKSPGPNNGYTASFKMDINPKEMSLNMDQTEGTTKDYTITDVMSDTLQLNFYTIKVVNVTAGNKVLDLNKNEYTLWYSKADRRLTITIKNADGQHFIVTYDAVVLGKVGSNEQVEYDNTATLNVGTTQINDYSETVKFNCNMSQIAKVSAGGAMVELRMTKFDSSRFQQKLEATFNLYKVEDADTNWENKTPVNTVTTKAIKGEENLTTLGVLGVVNHEKYPTLYQNQIYALVEAVSPDGYVQATEPYYFVLTADGEIEEVPGISDYDILTIYKKDQDTNELALSRNIQISNDPDPSTVGTLKITKSFDGDHKNLTAEQKNAVEFAVTYPDGSIVKNTYGKFKDGAWELTNLQPGKYTVTEVKTGVGEGYTVETTYDVAGSKSKDKAEIEVTKGKEFSVNVTNNYSEVTPKTGSLKITKNFTADDASKMTEAQKNAVKFTVTGEGYNASKTYGEFINGSWTIEDLTPGAYLVTEENTNIGGYSLKKTTYKVTTELATTTTENNNATASVSAGNTVAVDITNDYALDRGSLEITKAFSGYEEINLSADQKNAIEFTITGSNGYNETINYSQFTDGKYTLGDLEAGEYTVKETNAGIKGYTVTTSYDVTDGKVEVAAGKTGKIAITNTYTKE